MKFEYWLKRQGKTIEHIIKKNQIGDYEALSLYCKSLGLVPPEKSDVNILFKVKQQSPKIVASKKPVQKTKRKYTKRKQAGKNN